jgi:hypothetical protein
LMCFSQALTLKLISNVAAISVREKSRFIVLCGCSSIV